MRESPLRRGSAVRLPARGRLLATGDLHDNPVHLQKIIRLAKLDQSPDHHVVLHEMIHSERLVNNLDLSYRTLVRVAQLVLQYPKQVHPLLANHELAQYTGKGVSKGAGNSVELFNDGLAYVFGDDWEPMLDAIKTFITAMALALIAGNGVFCAHSLPSVRMMKHFDLGVLERELQPADFNSPEGSAHLMVWGRDHTVAQVDELAARWNVQVFCIGHEHAPAGIEVKGRMIILNSDHDRAVALPLDLSQTPNTEEAWLSVIPLNALPA